tara:strand:+ start:635 stop:1369 length:735 start_codon:yes stop_codon:yes gene_type:complete
VSISSRHATIRDSGAFTMNMGNTTFAEKTKAIIPISATITNIFPNIKSDYTITVPFGGGVVAKGQYTLAELAAAFETAISLVDVTVNVTSDKKIQVLNSSGDSATIEIPEPLALQIGFGTGSSTSYTMALNPAASETASHLPNLSGEQVVHIECDRLGHANMVHGRDGKLNDVIVTIPLHDTPYGFTKTVTTGDVNSYSIQYREPTSMSSTMQFRILDSEMEILEYPPNHHFEMIMKIHHDEHR